MYLFTKKRRDGELVSDGDIKHIVLPYLMRGRNESCVYLRHTIDVDQMQNFIRKNRREGRRITMMHLLMATLNHLYYLRPQLNRFIAGRRLYQRKDFEILFEVKTEMRDDAYSSTSKLKFDGSEDLNEIITRTDKIIQDIREGREKTDDKFISITSKLPRWFLRAFAQILTFMDFHGLMGEKLMEAIPLYASVFFSHIGSLGGPAPYHHLYEFGTCSLFITIGKVYERPKRALDDSIEWKRCVDICITADERICDGFYLMKSVKMCDEFFEFPELLEYSPAELKKLGDDFKKQLIKKTRSERKNNDNKSSREEEFLDGLEELRQEN
ncbi:MAG: hypothetical protein Q4P08_05410 [Eubacteriales bacterium]|nr:hypothetical protein [Eubacteriales bacterium]